MGVLALGLTTSLPAHAQDTGGAVIDQVGSNSEATATETNGTAPSVAQEIARRAPVGETQVLRRILDEDGTTASEEVLPGAGYSTGTTFLRQTGQANRARVTQQGEGHVVRILQNGIGNDVRITQSGTSHRASVALNGSQNDVGVVQQGAENRYELTASQDGIQHAQPYGRVQIGTGNTLIEQGGNAIPMRIQQQGDGMTMRIRHE